MAFLSVSLASGRQIHQKEVEPTFRNLRTRAKVALAFDTFAAAALMAFGALVISGVIPLGLNGLTPYYIGGGAITLGLAMAMIDTIVYRCALKQTPSDEDASTSNESPVETQPLPAPLSAQPAAQQPPAPPAPPAATTTPPAVDSARVYNQAQLARYCPSLVQDTTDQPDPLPQPPPAPSSATASSPDAAATTVIAPTATTVARPAQPPAASEPPAVQSTATPPAAADGSNDELATSAHVNFAGVSAAASRGEDHNFEAMYKGMKSFRQFLAAFLWRNRKLRRITDAKRVTKLAEVKKGVIKQLNQAIGNAEADGKTEFAGCLRSLTGFLEKFPEEIEAFVHQISENSRALDEKKTALKKLENLGEKINQKQVKRINKLQVLKDEIKELQKSKKLETLAGRKKLGEYKQIKRNFEEAMSSLVEINRTIEKEQAALERLNSKREELWAHFFNNASELGTLEAELKALDKDLLKYHTDVVNYNLTDLGTYLTMIPWNTEHFDNPKS